MKFIIEHLESRVYKWCFLEYKHISKIVGKQNVIFTNVKNAKDQEKLKPFGKVDKRSVAELSLKNCCVLDPKAKKTLNPKEAKKFDYFIFGGILGDHPPKERTKVLLTSRMKNSDVRNLGDKQFPTDNAVLVVKKIIEGKNLKEIRFADNIELEIKEGESVVIPYRYVFENGPVIFDELIEFIKKSGRF